MTHAVEENAPHAFGNPEAAFGQQVQPTIPEDPYAVSTQWSRGNEFKLPFTYAVGHGQIEESEIPSFIGKTQIAKLRRLDMGDLLKLGIAEELDFMTKGLLNEDKPQDSAKSAIESVILKAGNFARMETMINTVCLAGILAPKLYATPLHENARQKGLVYIDSIPFNDRMELFGIIFESEGLSTFREEQTPSVGNVADVPSVQLPADGPVALRSDDT
jgi:hypothetical protein